ncbi:uncharacterized protein LOC110806521 [Carica papaya]|uniref:uncharacterized protein LOC110806521 n=1 Tax=Carica papaya TaxID=3649 RepID=UPI000B8C908F|nr:uncharacterized protein LOC110806521 [Carica papaya]
MGRQHNGNDPTVVSSSIALLQERFRQLQRVREKREERELLKLFSAAESERTPPGRYDPNRLSLQPPPEMIATTTTRRVQVFDPDSSVSLGLNSQGWHPDYRAMMVPSSSTLWPNNSSTSTTSRNLDNSDVDTSLHL